MFTILINRHWQNTNQSTGVCTVIGDDCSPRFASVSLERGWRNNEKGVSCIPIGEYNVVLEYSNRFKTKLWEIKGVPNRSETKFHASNYWYQLEGCVALGRRPRDINKDGYIDVTGSKLTMVDFHKALNGQTKARLIITGEEGIF